MKYHTLSLIRSLSSISSNLKPKICVVGAGPAGFYATQHLVKNIPNVRVDILEKLPVPFGLVRFGVAPDHPEVKNVINTFTKTGDNPNVNFLGNVHFGRDVSLKELQSLYDVVLLTYGADENRLINIPGEDLANVISARKIVGWYNGNPADSDLKIDLSGGSCAIIGQGNVAIDVARILLTPIDLLRATDITQHALETLSTSKVKEVHLIGRRGPLQAAFTIKELREVIKLPNCSTYLTESDFAGIAELLPNLTRPRKRITELMLTTLKTPQKSTAKKFIPTFFKSPIELLGNSNAQVQQVILGLNQIDKSNKDFSKHSAKLTEARETLGCDLLVSSIGYKSIQMDSNLPFNSKQGVVQNDNGKISDKLYSCGWLATGPTGVILNTMSSSFATADLICQDLKTTGASADKPGFDMLEKILKDRNVQLVSWKQWKKIDEVEVSQGKKLGKPREKIIDVNKMLDVVS